MGPAGARRYWFEAYLRTGRLVTPDGIEHKFNPNHDPDNGRFTFAAGGSVNGERKADVIDGQRDPVASNAGVTFKKVRLTADQYNEQADALWNDMEGQKTKGLKNDRDVDRKIRDDKSRSSASEKEPTADVEAPDDIRRAVAIVSSRTSSARLRGKQGFEKTLTFERDADGRVVVGSLGLAGAQGGGVAGITRDTRAIAHVHYAGLSQPPFGLDFSSARAGIPSFVIGGEKGQIWEVGRKSGKYVQRVIRADGSAGRWNPFGR